MLMLTKNIKNTEDIIIQEQHITIIGVVVIIIIIILPYIGGDIHTFLHVGIINGHLTHLIGPGTTIIGTDITSIHINQ
jgi:hypothetical protein